MRHATDSNFYPSRLSNITVSDTVINRGNKTCIEWRCEVPASMKSEKYKTKVVMTTDSEIVSSDCECKVGGNHENIDESNMICIHIFSSIMKITMILLDYLAEDLCYELASIWKNVDLTNEYDTEDLKKVTTAVCILASVAYSSKGDLIMDDLTSLSIMEILIKHFSVGTERTKHSERSLSYLLEHTPLASLCEKSIFKIAEE